MVGLATTKDVGVLKAEIDVPADILYTFESTVQSPGPVLATKLGALPEISSWMCLDVLHGALAKHSHDLVAELPLSHTK